MTGEIKMAIIGEVRKQWLDIVQKDVTQVKDERWRSQSTLHGIVERHRISPLKSAKCNEALLKVYRGMEWGFQPYTAMISNHESVVIFADFLECHIIIYQNDDIRTPTGHYMYVV